MLMLILYSSERQAKGDEFDSNSDSDTANIQDASSRIGIIHTISAIHA